MPLRFAPLAFLLLLAAPAWAEVTISWVTVGNPGNPPDEAVNCLASEDCGSVPYTFQIGQFEVTNAQYAEFLNAVAAADPNELYDTRMAESPLGGITRSGSPGSFTYAVKPGRENNPVVFVSFWDAVRFANWLDNGQPVGPQGPATTEDGAYTLTPGGIAANTVARNPGLHVVLPNENEWYKAAYYVPGVGYVDHPFASGQTPVSAPPPGNAASANFFDLTTGYARTGSKTFNASFNYLTDVGAYTAAVSGYGTYDQGGNVLEWTETVVDEDFRQARGGSWDNLRENLAASALPQEDPADSSDYLGFRVARAVPEPTGAAPVAALALAGLAARRGRAARRRARAGDPEPCAEAPCGWAEGRAGR
ncbi:MAG TPA: SUMF1/EgtB/PvdO family nonheme iron enzyme [Myxococcota bacterium]